MQDLTKELYFTPHCSTTIAEVKRLFERLLAETWTIDIYRNGTPKTFNLKDLGWYIDYTNKKRSAGTCKRLRNRATGEIYNKRVCLSMHFLSQAQNLVETKGAEWEEVIRHELAHAVDVEMRGKSNHDRTWKAVAHQMLSNGRRTFSSDELEDNKTSKYTLICDTCEKEQKSHKRPSRGRGEAACGKCCKEHNNGRFDPRFVLRRVQNY